MDLGLKGKIALVTGGTRGIGLACARVLAQEGARVVICGRDGDRLSAALAECAGDGLDVRGRTADVTQEDSVQTLLAWIAEEYGALHILVNNAGHGSPGASLGLDESVWQNLLETNLTSAWRCSRLAAPLLARSGGGAIINISSISGRIAFTHQGAYPVSKAGLNALTRVMASELAAKNIRVVAVAPGFTETELLKNKHGSTEYLKDMTLLRRLASPEEIGTLVAFLASDAASYITAEVIEISGGAFRVRDPDWSWSH